MKPYRREKVAARIQQILSEAIAFELQDPRIEPMTSVTRVDVSGDLLLARAYLSVMGGESVERRTLSAVQHASGFLQRIVAQELNIRQSPEVRFEIDERAKRVRETLALLERNRRENPSLAADGGDAAEPGEDADDLSPDGTEDGDQAMDDTTGDDDEESVG